MGAIAIDMGRPVCLLATKAWFFEPQRCSDPATLQSIGILFLLAFAFAGYCLLRRRTA